MFDAEPEGWEQTTLGAIANLGGGTTPSKLEGGYWAEGSVPWATPSDITSLPDGVVRIAATELAITERALAECSLTLSPPGTVLMTSRATIGYAALNDVPMTTNQGFITFKCGDRVDAEFLLHWLTAKRDFLVAAAGGSTFKELSRGTAKLLPISLPPLPEQRRIAEVLRSVGRAIAHGDLALAAAESVRKCALDALMRGLADDPGAKAMALCEIAEVRTGLAKNKNAVGRHTRLPYLRVANVQDGWFDLSEMQEIDVEPDKVERYSLRAGDVLLTEGGDYDKLGRGALWKAQVHPCLHQNHVFSVRADRTRLLPEYLALLTQSCLGRSYFLSCAKRTTNLASINSTQLKDLPIPLPDLERQAAVVSEIGYVDRLIEAEEAKRDSLHELRASLRADLLSGSMRVPA